jgi:hypothetical protein
MRLREWDKTLCLLNLSIRSDMGGQLHSSDPFSLRKIRYQLGNGWAVPGPGLNLVAKIKFPCPCRESNPGYPACIPEGMTLRNHSSEDFETFIVDAWLWKIWALLNLVLHSYQDSVLCCNCEKCSLFCTAKSTYASRHARYICNEA